MTIEPKACSLYHCIDDRHIHGPEGVRFYTRLKTVTARRPSGIKDGAEFHFKSGSS